MIFLKREAFSTALDERGIDAVDTLRVTRELIEQGRSDAGGWNREQVASIGVPWPLVSGWIERAVGNPITDTEAAKFLALKGAVQPSTIKQKAKRARKLAMRETA